MMLIRRTFLFCSAPLTIHNVITHSATDHRHKITLPLYHSDSMQQPPSQPMLQQLRQHKLRLPLHCQQGVVGIVIIAQLHEVLDH